MLPVKQQLVAKGSVEGHAVFWQVWYGVTIGVVSAIKIRLIEQAYGI